MDVGEGDEVKAWIIKSVLKLVSDKFSWIIIILQIYGKAGGFFKTIGIEPGVNEYF